MTPHNFGAVLEDEDNQTDILNKFGAIPEEDTQQPTTQKQRSPGELFQQANKPFIETAKGFIGGKYSKGFAKGFASGATIGATEHIPGLETNNEPGSSLGYAAGVVAPFGLALKAVSIPLRLMAATAPKLAAAMGIGAAGGIGFTHEAARQAIAGEEPDPLKAAGAAAELATLDGLFKAVPAGYRWWKSLSPTQKAKMATSGNVPPDLPPSSTKFLENEVLPEINKYGEKLFQDSLAESTEQANLTYQQDLNNLKAKHQNSLYKDQQAQQAYQQELKQLAAVHEQKLNEINQVNQQAKAEYDAALQQYNNAQAKQQSALNAIRSTANEAQALNPNRVSVQAPDSGFRPAPPFQTQPNTQNQVGSIFSDYVSHDPVQSGQTLFQNLRQNSENAYNEVNHAYSKSKDLNSSIQFEHPNTAQWLINDIAELEAVPEPSGPTAQRIKAEKKILDALATVEDGQITGLKPINNQVLLDQAKELRTKIDFDFQPGKPSNTFKPLINKVQDAADSAAIATGNNEAYQANQEARNLYRQWSETFDNDYTRPLRDQANQDYSKSWKSYQQLDNYNAIRPALEQSPEGIEFSNALRRQIVSDKLSPYLENPSKVKLPTFQNDLNELASITSPEERRQITNQINQAAKRPAPPKATKATPAEKPKEPKLKEPPKLTTIPQAPKPASKEVQLPTKQAPKETPEMKIAEKITKLNKAQLERKLNDVDGIKELKEVFDKTESGKTIFKKLSQFKARDILYKGKMEGDHSAKELYEALNSRKDYELMEQLIGEEEAADLLTALRDGKNSTVNKEWFKKTLLPKTFKHLLILQLL